MKSLYGVAFCLLLTGSAYAQQVTLDQKTGTQVTVANGSDNAVVKPLAAQRDTLFDFLERTSQPAFYTAPDPTFNTTLPVFGTNSRFFYVGAKYSFTGSANVVGLIVSAAAVVVNGASDSLFITFMEADGTNLTPVGSPVFVRTNQLVFNQSDPLQGSTILNLPATPITKDFVAFFQTLSIGNTPDVVGLWSNTHGDGKGEKRALFMTFNQQGQPVVGDIGSVFNVGGQPIDADPYIFPILEFEEGAGVTSYPTLSGLTLKGAYPSTATNQTAVRFELDKPSAVNIDLLDLNGRIVKSYAAQQFGTGSHEMSLDLTGVPSGSYLYKVTTDRTQVASKLTIVR